MDKINNLTQLTAVFAPPWCRRSSDKGNYDHQNNAFYQSINQSGEAREGSRSNSHNRSNNRNNRILFSGADQRVDRVNNSDKRNNSGYTKRRVDYRGNRGNFGNCSDNRNNRRVNRNNCRGNRNNCCDTQKRCNVVNVSDDGNNQFRTEQRTNFGNGWNYQHRFEYRENVGNLKYNRNYNHHGNFDRQLDNGNDHRHNKLSGGNFGNRSDNDGNKHRRTELRGNFGNGSVDQKSQCRTDHSIKRTTTISDCHEPIPRKKLKNTPRFTTLNHSRPTAKPVPLTSSSSDSSPNSNSDDSEASVGHNTTDKRNLSSQILPVDSDSDNQVEVLDGPPTFAGADPFVDNVGDIEGDNESDDEEDYELPPLIGKDPYQSDDEDDDDIPSLIGNDPYESDDEDEDEDEHCSPEHIAENDQFDEEQILVNSRCRIKKSSTEPQHFRAPNDTSSGLDDLSDPLLGCTKTKVELHEPSEEYLNVLRKSLGDNNIKFKPPIVINRHNVEEYYDRIDQSDAFNPNNIKLFFNGCGDDIKRPVPDRVSPLDHIHWNNYNIVYGICVDPPKSGHDQIYIVDEAKRAVHHESYLVDILHAVRGSNLTLLYHPNDDNYRSAHSIVVNNQKDLKEFSSGYDTKATDEHIQRYGTRPKENSEGYDDNVTRIDSSTCNGGMCSSRNTYVPTEQDLYKKANTFLLLDTELQELILGCQVAIPRIHDGTEQDVVHDKMVFLSSILFFFFGKDMKLSPLQIGQINRYLCIEAITFNRNDRYVSVDGPTANHRSRFRSKRPPDSSNTSDANNDHHDVPPKFERCMEKLLRAHTDRHNCDRSLSRRIICVFKRRTIDGYLYTDIGYSKAQVFNSVEQIYKLLDTKIRIVNLLNDLSPFGLSRTSMNPKHQNPHVFSNINKPRILPQLLMVDTHINPTFAFQGVMNIVLLVQNRFNLDYVSLVSYLCTLDFSGHNPYYFITASVLYLNEANNYRRSSIDRKKFGEGFYFGWKFLNFLRRVYLYENHRSGHKPPASLHNRYTKKCINSGMSDISYTLDQFITLFTSRLLVANYCWTHLANSKVFKHRPSEVRFQYSLVESFFQKYARKSGQLVSGNVMMVWSWLGLIVPEFGRYRTLPDEKNKNIVGIANHYHRAGPNSKSISATTCTSVLTTIRSALKSVADPENITVTDAMVEHATCKIVREVTKAKQRDKWKTWLIPKQSIFLFHNDGVISLYNNTGEIGETLKQSALYHFWKRELPSRTSKNTLNVFMQSFEELTPDFVPIDNSKAASTRTTVAKKLFEKKVDLICTVLRDRTDICDYKIDFQSKITRKKRNIKLVEAITTVEEKLPLLGKIKPCFNLSYIHPLSEELLDSPGKSRLTKMFQKLSTIRIPNDPALTINCDDITTVMNHTTRSGSPFKDIIDRD